MCDTFVATGNATADGSVIFGKNSDREPNEAQEVVVFPAADHPQGSQVQCTYISIPQVPHTHAVLLSKPFWIWGAEMGLNEHGVAIGNEAIFTKVPHEKQPGLIGMDLLRLALERSKTALEALYTITTLLETYGQAGNCGFTHPFFYHNSFLIADPEQAWVLETVGRQWAAVRVNGFYSISNAATIGYTWDLASDNLKSFAVDQGLCKSQDIFHFAKVYSDTLYTYFSDARNRRSCAMNLLKEKQKSITVQTAAQVLRSHGERTSTDLRIDRSLTGATVCMHAGAGPVRNSQSVGSMVARLTPSVSTAWVTGTSAPCTSIFKPVWIDAGYPLDEPALQGRYDPRCLWWRHEKLHRLTLEDYSTRLACYQADRDRLEAQFFAGEELIASQDAGARRAFSAACFEQAEAATAQWTERIAAAPRQRAPHFYYAWAWKRFNKQAGMD